MPAGESELTTTLATAAIAGLAALAATPAAASPAPGTVHAAAGCIRVKATIPVGSSPFTDAANPKANTVYVANPDSGTVSVLAPCS